MMRFRVSLAACWLACAGCGAPPAPVTGDLSAVRTSADSAMRAYLAAIKTLDVAAVTAHYLDDPQFHVWVDGVRLDYPAWLAAVRADLARVGAVEGDWGEISTIPFGPDAALASAPFAETLTDTAGNVSAVRGAVTWVWVRRDGGWKIIHGHAVHVPDTAAAR